MKRTANPWIIVFGCVLASLSFGTPALPAQTFPVMRKDPVVFTPSTKPKPVPLQEAREAAEMASMENTGRFRQFRCDSFTIQNGLASYFSMRFEAKFENSISGVYLENLFEESARRQSRTPLIGWQFARAEDVLFPADSSKKWGFDSRCGSDRFEYHKSYRMAEGYINDSSYSICLPKNFRSLRKFPIEIYEKKTYLSGEHEDHFLPELNCSAG